jgi:hyperosmotically inducible protein
MSRSGLTIAAIVAAYCAAAERPPSPTVLPPALSQYAPLNVSNLSTFGENLIESEVHRELLELPFFGVFDHLAFAADGGTVVLHGQVLNPRLKGDAETVVANLAGVGRVVNMITFLPDSPADNRIRLAVFGAIYGHPSMSIYRTVGGGGAIHIVVQGGNVSLEGQVGSKADARKAAELARALPGVTGVTNHLTTFH